MFPTVTISDVRGQQMLNDLHDALVGSGRMGDAATVLEDEFRLAMKQIINLTPPPGLGQAARSQGEKAVTRDLSKLFTPVDEEMLNIIGSQFGVDGIDRWITDTDGGKQHLIWDKLDPTGTGIETFHHANQNRRGRTINAKRKGRGQPFWYAAYVVSKTDFLPYLQKLISHVGRRKAGWAAAYESVGGKVQRWISRHLPTPGGRVVNMLSNKGKPSITAFNMAPGIGDDQRIVADALRIRREAMAKRLKLILSGYSRDVANGIRISNKARKSTPSADE